MGSPRPGDCPKGRHVTCTLLDDPADSRAGGNGRRAGAHLTPQSVSNTFLFMYLLCTFCACGADIFVYTRSAGVGSLSRQLECSRHTTSLSVRHFGSRYVQYEAIRGKNRYGVYWWQPKGNEFAAAGTFVRKRVRGRRKPGMSLLLKAMGQVMPTQIVIGCGKLFYTEYARPTLLGVVETSRCLKSRVA